MSIIFKSIHFRSMSYKNHYQKLLLLLLAILFLLFCSTFMSQVVRAEKTTTRRKTIVSVQLKDGDTIWDLASKYYSEEYNNLHTYIEEIKKSNGLFDDQIHSGRYLIVPYYTEISE